MRFSNLGDECASPVSTMPIGFRQPPSSNQQLACRTRLALWMLPVSCESDKAEGDCARPVRKREGEEMKGAVQFRSNRVQSVQKDAYATMGDFQGLFAREMTDLFRLSLHLTADVEKAERCLILAVSECFANTTVSKGWAAIWARRTVVRAAIRLVLGAEFAMPIDICGDAGPDFHLQPSEYRVEALRDSLAILELPDFDRLAFVICVLERYSVLDCALLLKRSPKDVNEARVRAINRVVSADERDRHDSTTASPYTSSRNGTGEFDDACGSLLD